MPLYEYFCHDCERTYEAILPAKDYKKEVKCPSCKKPLKKYVGKVHLSSKRVTYGY